MKCKICFNKAVENGFCDRHNEFFVGGFIDERGNENPHDFDLGYELESMTSEGFWHRETKEVLIGLIQKRSSEWGVSEKDVLSLVESVWGMCAGEYGN